MPKPETNARLQAFLKKVEGIDHAEEVVEYLRGLSGDTPRQLGHFAPVLYVQKVLEPELCRRLIQLHQTAGSVPTKVYRPGGAAGRGAR